MSGLMHGPSQNLMCLAMPPSREATSSEIDARVCTTPFLETMTERAYHGLVVSGLHSERVLATEFDQVRPRYGTHVGEGLKLGHLLACVAKSRIPV